MARKKKNMRKKINPEKSNKMIYAVIFGLVIVFAAFFVIISSGDREKPANKKEHIESVLKYLNKTSGVNEIEIDTEKNLITIKYEEKDKMDHTRVAQYAGIKVSSGFKEETFEVRLVRTATGKREYSFFIRNGKVLRFEKGQADQQAGD